MSRSYHAVYSISDLHLGGRAGFQMFDARQAPKLAGAIREVAARLKGRRGLLVLNGDIVDTLAEPGGAVVRVEDATSVLERIAKDDAFSEVFSALGAFAATPGATLLVCIGNHDLELAFPPVQDRLVDLLTAGLGDQSEAAAERIRFHPPGQPVRVTVGGRVVYLTHSNELDSWNVVDLEQLSWAIDRQARGLEFDAERWTANAGTRLVVKVMNELKRSWPFVDLLKPETDLALPLLLALDKRAISRLPTVLPLFARKVTQPIRQLGLAEDDDRPARPSGADDLIAEALRACTAPPRDVDHLDLADDVVWGDADADDVDDGRLDNSVVALVNGFFGRLRDAMRVWTKGTAPFTFNQPDANDTRLIERIGPGVDFVIAGHTHLARAYQPKDKPFVFFNTGTWARLMQITSDDVENDQSWAIIERALRAGTVTALDDADLPAAGGLPPRKLAFTRGYVSVVEVHGDQVIGRLWNPDKPYDARGEVGIEQAHAKAVRK